MNFLSLEKEISDVRQRRAQAEMQEKYNHLYAKKRSAESRFTVLEARLANPNIIIQNQLTQTAKKEWRNLKYREERLNEICNRFNPLLLRFGAPWTAVIALSMTLGIGLYWVWATMGIDALGGNPVITVAVFCAILIAIDTIGYFAIFGIFASLQNFMARQTHLRLLEVMIMAGFCIGLLCFFGNLMYRILEVGI